jgi:hypothetical protein
MSVQPPVVIAASLAIAAATAGVVIGTSSSKAPTRVLGEKTSASGTNGNGNGNGGCGNGNGKPGCPTPSPSPSPNGNGNGNGNGGDHKNFTITDRAKSTTNLYPGAAQPRWLTLSNPNNFIIQVSTLTATVGQPTYDSGATATGCTSSMIRVDPLASPVNVPAGGSTDVALTVRMSNTPAPACKGANFPLTYSGTAVKP